MMQDNSVQPQTATGQGGAESANDKPLEQLLAEAQARMEEHREQMLRAVAETENVRKRLQAEAAASQKYALERFAESLLPVLDSLEAGVKSQDASGVELTLRQMKAVLEKASIREIDPSPGERFDPHRHQAMAAVEAKVEPNSVVAVMQKGYGLHDRVLRPALVTVARPPVEKSTGNPISDTDLD